MKKVDEHMNGLVFIERRADAGDVGWGVFEYAGCGGGWCLRTARPGLYPPFILHRVSWKNLHKQPCPAHVDSSRLLLVLLCESLL